MSGESAHYRVLVLDDERDMIEMVTRMLRGSYTVTGTTSAVEALAWLDEQRFDAVIVDQRLRDGTGTSVLARCAEVSPLCRRIAMSGQAEMGDLLAAINVAKVSRFILKPFSRQVLVDALDQALAEYRAERDALEGWLVSRSAGAGPHNQVLPRKGGRRSRGRGRPEHWPESSGVIDLDPSDSAPLEQLFDPDIELVLAQLRPDASMDAATLGNWLAEVELRLVTRLRDTDQAFRLPDDRFVVAFARTNLHGCSLACHRLADRLLGGLRIDMVGWPDESGRIGDPQVIVAQLLGRY